VAYNFQIGNNNIKLLTGCESVSLKVLSLIKPILHNAKQLQHARLSWHVRGPSVLQHLRCDRFDRSNNFELQFIEGDHMSLTHPYRKKSSGIISGERGGHGIGPSRPTQRPGNCMWRNSRTIRAQFGGVHHLAGTPHLADGLPSGVTDNNYSMFR
jgi:hypothetical protein